MLVDALTAHPVWGRVFAHADQPCVLVGSLCLVSCTCLYLGYICMYLIVLVHIALVQ